MRKTFSESGVTTCNHIMRLSGYSRSEIVDILITNIILGPHEISHGIVGFVFGQKQQYNPLIPGWELDYRLDEAASLREIISSLAPLLLSPIGIWIIIATDTLTGTLFGIYLLYNSVPSTEDLAIAFGAYNLRNHEHQPIECRECNSGEAVKADISCYCPDCDSLWTEQKFDSLKEAWSGN